MLGSQQNWVESIVTRYTLPYIHTASLTSSIPYQSGTFVTTHEFTLTCFYQSGLKVHSLHCGSHSVSWGFCGGSDVSESACNAGGLGLSPGPERRHGEKNGYPLQYSCLENSIDRGAWRATVHGVRKNQTRLVTNTFTLHLVVCILWILRNIQ